MPRVLYEYSSPRNDNGVLTWHEGETFTIPFQFNIETTMGQICVIEPQDKVTLFIKKDVRYIEKLYERIYTDVKENMILFTVDEELSNILRRGNYVLFVKLNYGFEEMNLINNLPIKVLA